MEEDAVDTTGSNTDCFQHVHNTDEGKFFRSKMQKQKPFSLFYFNCSTWMRWRVSSLLLILGSGRQVQLAAADVATTYDEDYLRFTIGHVRAWLVDVVPHR